MSDYKKLEMQNSDELYDRLNTSTLSDFAKASIEENLYSKIKNNINDSGRLIVTFYIYAEFKIIIKRIIYYLNSDEKYALIIEILFMVSDNLNTIINLLYDPYGPYYCLGHVNEYDIMQVLEPHREKLEYRRDELNNIYFEDGGKINNYIDIIDLFILIWEETIPDIIYENKLYIIDD